MTTTPLPNRQPQICRHLRRAGKNRRKMDHLQSVGDDRRENRTDAEDAGLDTEQGETVPLCAGRFQQEQLQQDAAAIGVSRS